MTAKVLRWQIPVDDKTTDVAFAGDIVAVAATGIGTAVEFWTLADDQAPTATRSFRVFGTGQSIPDGWTWRGTTARTATGLVWHLFEKLTTTPRPEPTPLPPEARRAQ